MSAPCPECNGTGAVWPQPERCTCGTGPSGYYGMHERYCGAEPCPAGCPFNPPPSEAKERAVISETGWEPT